MDKQGYQTPAQDKEVSACLHLARLVNTDLNDDTVNPDQDIKPMFKCFISMSWRDQCIKETVAQCVQPFWQAMHRQCVTDSQRRPRAQTAP